MIGGLPVLKGLYLDAEEGPKESFFIPGFHCLRSFTPAFFKSGMGLMFEAGSMPKLEECNFLFKAHTTQSLNGDFDFGIQHLLGLIYFAVMVDIDNAS